MCNSDITEKILEKLEFDQDEKNFIQNIVGDTPSLPNAITSLALVKLSKSIALYTKWLFIATFLLGVIGILQLYIAFR